MNASTSRQSNCRQAFSLLELITVIAIIGVLAAIAFPAVQKARDAARRVHCSNNMRQLAIAATNYSSIKRRLPSGINSPSADKYGSSSWLTHLLPFLELNSIWEQASLDYQYDPVPFRSHNGMTTVISQFICPNDSEASGVHWTHDGFIACSTNYIGVNGTDYQAMDGVFFRDSVMKISEIHDGLSNTLLLGERPPSPDFWYGWWYAGRGRSFSGSPDMLLGVNEILLPPDEFNKTWLEHCDTGLYDYRKGKFGNQCDTLRFWSYHTSGSFFAFVDGSVNFLSYNIDQEILNQYSTRNGGE